MPKDFHQSCWDAQVADDCRRLVRLGVAEDLDRGQDWTTLCLTAMEATGCANLVARQEGIIAGLPAVQVVLDEIDRSLQLTSTISDGAAVAAGTVLANIAGPARSLLTAERLLLNFVGRLSGIATLTAQFAKAVAGTKAKIYDTRKTIPGWRRLEKYAVGQGGGRNHRTGLFDAVLIKDNHLAMAASLETVRQFSLSEAVRRARTFLLENFPGDDPRREMIVEIEVDSLAQLVELLPQQPDIVLLDNMNLDQLRRAVALRNVQAPKVELEASGGVSLATVKAIAETGVERISSGALTHSAVSFDVALDWTF